MTGPHVGPADEGTGVPQGDEADVDAANVAAYIDNPNARDFVVSGLQLQNIDYATPQVDLTAGKARLHAASAQTESGGTNNAETRDHVTFVGEWTARTGLSLTDGATNRIWIYMDLATSNGEQVRVDTAASPNVPPQPRVQVAEVDTATDTAVEQARKPDADFGSTTHDSIETGTPLTVSDSGTDLLSISGSGPVEVQNTGLRLDTGQSIEDGSGNIRLNLDSIATNIADSNGRDIINIRTDVDTNFFAYSNTPVRIYDQEGGFDALQYTTSASAPGTLELTNSVFRQSFADATIAKWDDGADAYIKVDTSQTSNSESSRFTFRDGDGDFAHLYNSDGELIGEDGAGNTSTLT